MKEDSYHFDIKNNYYGACDKYCSSTSWCSYPCLFPCNLARATAVVCNCYKCCNQTVQGYCCIFALLIFLALCAYPSAATFVQMYEPASGDSTLDDLHERMQDIVERGSGEVLLWDVTTERSLLAIVIMSVWSACIVVFLKKFKIRNAETADEWPWLTWLLAMTVCSGCAMSGMVNKYNQQSGSGGSGEKQPLTTEKKSAPALALFGHTDKDARLVLLPMLPGGEPGRLCSAAVGAGKAVVAV